VNRTTMYKRIIFSFVAVLTICSGVLFPIAASANSAEPPVSIVIINNAPAELTMEAELNGEFVLM